MEKGRPVLGVCLLLLLGGCGNRGENMADQINLSMVAKIESGEIKTMEQLVKVEGRVMEDSMKELGIDPESRLTTAENDTFTSSMDNFRKEWGSLIRETWGARTQ